MTTTDNTARKVTSSALAPPQFPPPGASEWGEDVYGLWIAITVKEVRLAFRWIPPGTFMMGSQKDEKGRYDDEDYHQVTLSNGFWLAETVVTQALWLAVMGDSHACGFEGEELPVDNVSWDLSKKFIQLFNTHYPPLEVRLPWEAEWEYACRSNSVGAFHFDKQISLELVNYNGNWDAYISADEAIRQTGIVKSYPCNDWGLYEMHGNVWEWCQDEWKENLGSEPTDSPFSADTKAERRVIRGGSWSNLGRNCRSACRNHYAPDFRRDYTGFRLALGQESSGLGERSE